MKGTSYQYNPGDPDELLGEFQHLKKKKNTI